MINEARQAILNSIRSQLAASMPDDDRELRPDVSTGSGSDRVDLISRESLVERFKHNLEAVGAHCTIASGDTAVAHALTQIITSLQRTPVRAQRIAISDAPDVERLLYLTDLEIEALAVAPNACDVFGFDVGITTVQAAIAETGTLVLDSTQERNRLVSLVPPVHIALVNAATVCETLGEALNLMREDKELSPAVTFITGPSRTADIELTLTVGVHGPQELYVIVT